MQTTSVIAVKSKPAARWAKACRLIVRDRYLFVLVLPCVVCLAVFFYTPMAGLYMGFTKFKPGQSIFAGEFVGLKWFLQFFNSIYFWRLIRNTFSISILNLIFGFPLPIIFALLLHEVKNMAFKRVVQTVSYMPHFISVMVTVGMLYTFLSPNGGAVNLVIEKLGGRPINFLGEPSWFRGLYVGSGIWQEFGWGSIIYLAAISGIDPTTYESARIDGANRWRQMWNVSLPGISGTVIILMILAVGRMMSVGFEKIILMYTEATYETADVISTYVYRRGIVEADYSFATAVGLFNSIVNFSLVVIANAVARRVSEVSLF